MYINFISRSTRNCATYGGGGGGGGRGSPSRASGGTGGGGGGGSQPTGSGEAGTANTGGGGGGAVNNPGVNASGAGGSGIVVIKELCKASGVWSMQSQFDAIQGGAWPKKLLSLQGAAVMIVGGGGGAPSAPSPGGGGAGGMILSPGPVAIIGCSESGTVDITIGAGGNGGACGGGCGSLGLAGNDTTVTITGGTPLVAKGGGRGQSPGDATMYCSNNRWFRWWW